MFQIAKLLSFLFLFTGVLFGDEYPQTFSSLGTPLYKASKQLTHYDDIPSLSKDIRRYNKRAKVLLQKGLQADKSTNKSEKLAYLKELRALQKEYDYINHLLHREIQKAIDKNDYDSFIDLTSYKLAGLLEPSSFRQRVIDYYKKHRREIKSALLEKYIEEEKLLEASSQEFINVAKSSKFSSHTNISNKHKDLYITTKKYKEYVDIFFTNKNNYAVTLEVQEELKNMQASRYKENIFVVPAGATIRYARLHYKAPKARYSFSYRWIMGSKDAKADDYIYRLPYRVGESHRVSQGFNGVSTHKGHSRYAVDFQMDVGTKIYAARDGIVVKTKDDSDKRGFAPEFAKYGNYVTILHSDGTFATYYHLKKGGVLVSVGQMVTRGSALGYSGNTGYTSGPHLHFAVFKATKDLKTQSIPVKFISAKGVVTEPKKGRYYKAK